MRIILPTKISALDAGILGFVKPLTLQQSAQDRL
jgi:hypothetical protein